MPVEDVIDTCTRIYVRSTNNLFLGPMNEDGTIPLVASREEAGMYRMNNDTAACTPISRSSRYYLTDLASSKRVGAPKTPIMKCNLFGEVPDTHVLFHLGGGDNTYRLIYNERIVPWYATNCDNMLGVTIRAADSLSFHFERADDEGEPTTTPKKKLWWIILISVLAGLLLICFIIGIGFYMYRHKQNGSSQGAQQARSQSAAVDSQPWSFGGFGGTTGAGNGVGAWNF